ncbi:unnamed protein product [Urochloa humidicola]
MVRVDLTHGRMDIMYVCWQQDKPMGKNIIEASADWLHMACKFDQDGSFMPTTRTQEHCASRKETYGDAG